MEATTDEYVLASRQQGWTDEPQITGAAVGDPCAAAASVMGTVFLHFVAGTLGSLAVFLAFFRLSGASSFSAPFGVVFIGIACASLAHFVSPWATPTVLTAYALVSAVEYWQESKARKP